MTLSSEFPEAGTSSYAEEGTLLHSLANQALDIWPGEFKHRWKDKEHQLLVESCVSYVTETMAGDKTMLLEQRVDMNEQVYGTADVILYNEYFLHVIDFKFGAGVEVSAQDNPQLLAYLIGAINLIDKSRPKPDYQPKEMYVHIVQPRLDKADVVQVFPEDLTAFTERVEQAILLAESKNPPIHPGKKQCKWCPCTGCRARSKDIQAKAILALDVMADPASMNQEVETIENLAKILATRKAVEAGFNAIENFLCLQAQQGSTIPGFKLARSTKRRTWKEDTDVEVLAAHFGVDEVDLIKTTLLSPAQVEKLLPKASRPELAEFFYTPEGDVTLVPETSAKREITSGVAEMADEVPSSSIKYAVLE